MYRVLLPVDKRDSRARAQAHAVITLPQADSHPADSADPTITVDILHVHGDVTGPDAEWAAGGGFSETYAEEMAENVDRFDRLPESVSVASEVLESASIVHTVHETTGDPAETILEAATEYESDLIVLGVQDRSPVGKILFGSVAQAVLLDSDRPVMTAPVTEMES